MSRLFTSGGQRIHIDNQYNQPYAKSQLIGKDSVAGKD